MVTETQIPKGYKKTEAGIIPEDWEAEPIGNFFEFKNGLNKAKEFFGKGTPIVNYMDVFSNSGFLCSDIEGKVTLTSDEIRNYQVRKGDVFFTRTSETVDEIGMSSVMLEDIKDAVFSGFVLRGRPKNGNLHLLYKKYCFRFEKVRKQICSTSSYTTRALTNGRLLSKVFIAVPPDKAEQKSIATVLSDIDKLITNLDELLVKKRNVKQGTMQELLAGKKRLPGFSGEWEEKPLGEIFSISAGGDLIKESFSEIKDDKYCYPIYSNALTNKGLYGYTDSFRHGGNRITVTARGTIGVANARDRRFDAIGRLLILKPLCNLNCLYISEYINQRIVFSIESTGVPQLTVPQISKYEIAFPGSKEQSAIVI